jgi:hypothetical protein
MVLYLLHRWYRISRRRLCDVAFLFFQKKGPQRRKNKREERKVASPPCDGYSRNEAVILSLFPAVTGEATSLGIITQAIFTLIRWIFKGAVLVLILSLW